MKKYLSIAIIFIITVSNANGQAILQRSWSDGDTLFSQYSSFQGVVVDSTVRLIPYSEIHEPDSFRYILYGEDGIWPLQKFPISAAYDIDFISEKNKNFYLVTDGFGRRVFEINYTDPDDPIEAGFSFTGQSRPLINPVDASIFYENGDRKILITDAGGNRVVKVDRLGGDEEWTYGDGNSGMGQNQLSGPSDALALPDTNLYLICDQGNSRIILVEPSANNIVWSYGNSAELNPVDIEFDQSTNSVLVTDRGNHRVFLIRISDSVVIWQYGTGEQGSGVNMLDSPTDADLLENGNILICDAGNNRLLEVDRDGQVDWSFEHRPLKNLSDADRLPDNRTIIVSNYQSLFTNIPIWLAYSDSVFVSDYMNIGKTVNLDSLYWDGEIPENSEIRLQIRSSDNPANLGIAQWRGPSDSELFFTDSVSAVNPAYHQGHSYYQFKAFLQSNDTLHTPILNNVRLRYHYYNDKQSGTITSDAISAQQGYIITKWMYLNFNTIQREARNIKISILDGETGQILIDFFAETIDTVKSRNSLEIWDQLKGKQSVRLRATLSTKNTATTPQLQSWGLEWNSTLSADASIKFVNSEDDTVQYYRVSSVYPPVEKKVDQVFVKLSDLNLAAVQEAITLQIRALRSGDILDVSLERDPNGDFALSHGIPAVIFNLVIPANTFLEVFNRDTLVISYTDPTTPTDVSADTALIIENTRGELSIVDVNGVAVDTMTIGDTLYVRVDGDHDRNIDERRDEITVEVLNTETSDQEFLTLVEIPDSNNVYYTGNFISQRGLRLAQNATGIKSDSLLQTMPSNQVAARYEDNVTLQDVIYIRRTGYTPPDSVFLLPTKALDFDVAPNPFYMNRHTNFRLKASSAIADLRVERVEIYNLAGQLVRSIPGENIRFDLSQPIPRNVFSYAENWWDFRNENNQYISSGMYFIKMIGSVANGGEGSSEEIEAIKKIIIFR